MDVVKINLTTTSLSCILILKGDFMGGTATWMEKCPACLGAGKIQTWDKKAKKISPSEDCPVCEGRGYVMIQKNIQRRKA
jgi:DnaJ-class molecular chaperone